MLFDAVRWEKPIETKVEPWRELLLKAADVLVTHGWCQNAGEDAEGRKCAASAISYVAGNIHRYASEAANHLLFYINKTSQRHFGGIPDWNDHPMRTKEEVIATLRAAAKENSYV